MHEAHHSIVTKKIRRISPGQAMELDDMLAVEEPLEISLEYHHKDVWISKIISITMRTPGHDQELASGFLFNEGIIHQTKTIFPIDDFYQEKNRIRVRLKKQVIPNLEKAERHFYTSSSCGVCGKTNLESINTISSGKHRPDQLLINPSMLYSIHQTLKENQSLFECTGGLHASALFDANGKFITLREDVGRHNAMDKLIGYAFLNDRLPLSNCILLLSGRASFELIQKSIMAGICIVAAVGAPSSLAVELAADHNLTLLGFLKTGQFNIYSGGHRLLLEHSIS